MVLLIGLAWFIVGIALGIKVGKEFGSWKFFRNMVEMFNEDEEKFIRLFKTAKNATNELKKELEDAKGN